MIGWMDMETMVMDRLEAKFWFPSIEKEVNLIVKRAEYDYAGIFQSTISHD